jgi:nitrate/TMAO reductase-like tetraheme cytochrome c subunit
MERETPRPWWRAHLLWIVVLAVLVTAGAATAGLWHVSTSPRLCNSCHIMQPYVDAWRASKHANVTCVQCHYPPGFRDTLWVKYQALSQVAKWATHTYSSKPFAEVEDASCLRSGCHDRDQLAGKKTFERGVLFDHGRHLRWGASNGPPKPPGRSGRPGEAGPSLGHADISRSADEKAPAADAPRGPELRCTSCHTQVVVSTHIQVTESTCFLCHFKGAMAGRELRPIAGCTGCHQTPPGDIVLGTIRFSHEEVRRRGVACQSCHLNVVEGDGAAPRERCLTCHNQAEQLARYGDQPFIHAAHVTTHNIECGRCHTAIQHRLPPLIGVAAQAPGAGPPR